MSRAAFLAVPAFALVVGLAGCGKPGELERPGPLWGPKAHADYSQAKRNQAAAASNATAAGQPGQPPAQGPDSNPYANPAPPPLAPIPGERTYPSGAPQSGAQPQPR